MTKTRLDRHTYTIDEIVVGGSLSSLLFAFYTDRKVVFIEPQKPFMFDEIEATAIPGINKKLAPKIPAVQVWEHLLFTMSLNGQIIGSDLNQSIRVQDDILKVTTQHSRLTRIRFKKLFVFEPEEITGLPAPTKIVRGKHHVYDWFNVYHGASHAKTIISTNDDFMNKIWFYTSARAIKNEHKDCVSLSILTDEEIKNFDYSETVTRIKIESILKELKINKNPEVEHADREIYENISYTFAPDEKFEFLDLTPEQIIATIEPKRKHKHAIFFPHGRNRTARIEANRL